MAQDPNKTLVLVTTDQPAECSVRGGPAAKTPLLVRSSAGAVSIVCSATIQGIKLKRTTNVDVVAGHNLHVRIGMLGGSAR